MKQILYSIVLAGFCQILYSQQLYKGNGQVLFLSEAPLETIRAQSEKLDGIIDVSKNNFAFQINVNSFDGFNSALQKEHFNEHYLETQKYPKATFTGKIILQEECLADCVTSATAKGKLKIHGVIQIASIPVSYRVKDHVVYISSNFMVLLSDYDIKIPRIVQAKISPEIEVNIEIELKP